MSQPDESAVREWTERSLGGRVVSCERQPRWRPAWFLEVERAGKRIPVYFRGDRGISDATVYGLEHEMACLQVLEAEGVPVPHVYGFCPEPRGILMERSPGRAELSTALDDTEARSVQRHYMEILANMHRLDIGPFLSAGLEPPASAEQLALADIPLWEKGYRRGKTRPEPLIEFGLRWLRRNMPPPAGPACFVCGDSGQFLFDSGRVTAVIDLELAHLGDPAEDLGGLRNRDLSEPLGDIGPAIADYEEFIGHSVDRFLIDYHTVRFALLTPLAIVPVLATARPGVDLVQYFCWYHVYSRAPIELIAHAQGVELVGPEIPAATPNAQSPMYADLLHRLSPEDGEEQFDQYANNTAYRTAVYLQRLNDFGPSLEAGNLMDINALLRTQFTNVAQADAALETWILEADPGADEDLLRLLHRRCVRQEILVEPILGPLADARIQLLD